MTDQQSNILNILARFNGPDLTTTLSRLESAVRGVRMKDCIGFLETAGAGYEVLEAAAELKRQAGQNNVTIHALGILLCLPHLLEADEFVEFASLGAGNTGRSYDLETNKRVAEFKFIRWRGGPESTRQNGIFKDYLLMALDPTPKRKYLYLLETYHPLRFFRSGRAISSVLGSNDKLRQAFSDRFGSVYRTVGEFYAAHAGAVEIVDVSSWLSALTDLPNTDLERPDY